MIVGLISMSKPVQLGMTNGKTTPPREGWLRPKPSTASPDVARATGLLAWLNAPLACLALPSRFFPLVKSYGANGVGLWVCPRKRGYPLCGLCFSVRWAYLQTSGLRLRSGRSHLKEGSRVSLAHGVTPPTQNRPT